jgi:F-type H+-transporting ATPase subunit O
MFSRQALLRTARTAAPQRALLGQTRTFAAPASSEKVKPPVALFGLDGTYATALVRPSRPTNWSSSSCSGGRREGCGLEGTQLPAGWKWEAAANETRN